MREDVIAKNYGMVLDHNLFVEYNKFIQGEGYNRPLVSKMLSFFHGGFLTNVRQYTENGVQIKTNLKSELIKNGLNSQSLEELAALTTYKIILTDERKQYPFVNIKESRFTPVLSAFYEGDSNRIAAKDYLRNLCKGAKKSILLYDLYISEAHDLDALLAYILPNSKIQFTFSFNKISVAHRNRLQASHPNLSFKNLEGVRRHHDRYLIIDGTIEVVLTSGFEYLQNQKKEISLVIRSIKDMHGLRV